MSITSDASLLGAPENWGPLPVRELRLAAGHELLVAVEPAVVALAERALAGGAAGRRVRDDARDAALPAIRGVAVQVDAQHAADVELAALGRPTEASARSKLSSGFICGDLPVAR